MPTDGAGSDYRAHARIQRCADRALFARRGALRLRRQRTYRRPGHHAGGQARRRRSERIDRTAADRAVRHAAQRRLGAALSAVRGDLHLIPVTLGDTNPRLALSPSALQAACELDYFLAENAKSARQFLKGIAHPRTLRELQIECFDKDSNAERAAELLQPLLTGRSAGVLSEAGSPAVADPGALLVAAAHRLRIRVVPHIGPSAILLALMATGFNGHRFAFHGYLPVPKDECRRAI